MEKNEKSRGPKIRYTYSQHWPQDVLKAARALKLPIVVPTPSS